MLPVNRRDVQREDLDKAVDLAVVMRWRNQLLDRNSWRRDAATEVDYYDGNQYDAETIARMRDRGLPILPINCIRKPINAVIGLQRTNMTDFRVTGEDNQKEKLYEAMSVKLKEAERITLCDEATLSAYESQVKAGIGWVEVGENPDPFGYQWAVQNVPWREMDWDRTTKELKPYDPNCNYVRRAKFYPRQDLLEAFEGQKELIQTAATTGDTIWWDEPEQYERGDWTYRDPSIWAFQQTNMDMLCIEEYWYKVTVTGYVMRLPNGLVLEFNQNDPGHMAAYQRGVVDPKPTKFKKVRQAYWIGPHRLLDRWSPLPHNEFPYVPFVGYIEERTGVPYGLIRDMRYLQDEINTRRSKMAWGLNAVRMIADIDAFKDVPGGWQRAQQEIGRADAVIIKNRNTDVKIDEHEGINRQQYDVYQDAKATIGEVSGINDPFVGDTDSAGQSGKSQEIQIDRTITSLGKIHANYKAGRQKVGQLLLAHVVSGMGMGEEIEYEDKQHKMVKVQVNVPTQHEDGHTYLTNNLTLLQMRATLEEMPTSPTFRAMQFQEITRTLTAMPPDVQALMVPVLVEASELPNRKDVADMLRKKLGIGEPSTPEEAAQMEAEAQKSAMLEDLQLREFQAKVDKMVADAMKSQAGAGEAQAKAEKTLAQIQEVMAKVADMLAGTAKKQAETDALRQDIAAQQHAMDTGQLDAGKTTVMARW